MCKCKRVFYVTAYKCWLRGAEDKFLRQRSVGTPDLPFSLFRERLIGIRFCIRFSWCMTRLGIIHLSTEFEIDGRGRGCRLEVGGLGRCIGLDAHLSFCPNSHPFLPPFLSPKASSSLSGGFHIWLPHDFWISWPTTPSVRKILLSYMEAPSKQSIREF